MTNNLEWFRVPEKIYFKKGSLPIALRELKEVYDRKKAVVITDNSGFRNGTAKPVTDMLDELHIFYSLISVEETETSVLAGLDSVKKFEPDCIIAVGNTAVTAGKLIRILYENPELTFAELSERVHLRDRSLNTLKTGKAYFIAVAASDSVGDEVSPFSMEVPETELGVQDYALLPDMSIIDTDMIQKEDVQAIAFMCLVTVRSSIWVFNSEFTSDYAKGLALRAMQLVFSYFPKYQTKPDDMYVLERLSNASEMASMAFSNVCDGSEQEKTSLSVVHNAPASALGMTEKDFEGSLAEISRAAYPESN